MNPLESPVGHRQNVEIRACSAASRGESMGEDVAAEAAVVFAGANINRDSTPSSRARSSKLDASKPRVACRLGLTLANSRCIFLCGNNGKPKGHHCETRYGTVRPLRRGLTCGLWLERAGISSSPKCTIVASASQACVPLSSPGSGSPSKPPTNSTSIVHSRTWRLADRALR